jgi:serine/threonine protein phosphatase PrpC
MSNYKQVPEHPLKAVRDIGFVEDRNARYRRTMEDGHCMIDGFRGNDNEAFFGVYDGHGGKGVVTIVEANFHKNLEQALNKHGIDHVKEALEETYVETDANTKDVQFSGSTSVTCLITADPSDSTKRILYTANCGDARAIISENGTAHRLTHDHKVSDEAETERIKNSGGSVISGRVNGYLAVARAFGNNTMKQYVISTPYQSEVKLTPEHTLLILACDGVWDVIEDQEAVDFVNQKIQEENLNAQSCAQELLALAKEKGSTDNLSIIIVFL